MQANAVDRVTERSQNDQAHSAISADLLGRPAREYVVVAWTAVTRSRSATRDRQPSIAATASSERLFIHLTVPAELVSDVAGAQ